MTAQTAQALLELEAILFICIGVGGIVAWALDKHFWMTIAVLVVVFLAGTAFIIGRATGLW